ncbi:hypothetical protein [Christiangramia echinicola]|uniref:Uncharacterized protein n=1 Tax=Christiangramia echinicola TaxID=279359 RepID=A0A1H1KWB0_9FLAO|nr:hypothetical protein [Christiangramia echinicola]SDR66065.1 hypothetical protein SAMN04488552_0235 [Christiangramia echinicola]
MNFSWKNEKGTFLSVVGILSILFLLTFYYSKPYKKDDLKNETFILSENPNYQKHRKKRDNTRNYIELSSANAKYIITGIDYQFLSKEYFNNDIKKGDTLEIGRIDNKILKLKKGRFDYIDFNEAQNYKINNKVVVRALCSIGLIFSIIPLFYKNRPTYKDKSGEEKEFKLGCLWIFLVFLIFILVYFTRGLSYMSIKEILGVF